MVRERFDVAGCIVARLMQGMGPRGIVRGKPARTITPEGGTRTRSTTRTGSSLPKRQTGRWLPDFTHASTWSRVTNMAFVINASHRGQACEQESPCPFHARYAQQALHRNNR